MGRDPLQIGTELARPPLGLAARRQDPLQLLFETVAGLRQAGLDRELGRLDKALRPSGASRVQRAWRGIRIGVKTQFEPDFSARHAHRPQASAADFLSFPIGRTAPSFDRVKNGRHGEKAAVGKGYGDPDVVTALERANRLVAETAAVGTPLHFYVLYGLWVSTANSGTVAAALEHATNFLSSAQSQPSSGPLLVGHRILAVSLIDSGDYRAALAHVETAASLYRPDEHRDSAFHYGQDIGVSAFVVLSWALWHRGYPDQSARAADRALVLSRELGHAHALAHAFAMAGRAAVFARDVAAVHAYGNNCVAIASEHGFAQWAANGRLLQGWADAQRGEATTGIARIRDGLAAAEATSARSQVPLYSVLLADVLALAGKIEEGLATLDDALATAAVSGVRGWDAEIHRLRGELTARLPHPDPAKPEDSFLTALAIAREQGTRGYELRAATSLARLWGEQGRRGEARDLLAPVYGWFTEGFDTADLKDAKALLDELA